MLLPNGYRKRYLKAINEVISLNLYWRRNMFILAFACDGIEGLSSQEVKEYIGYIANRMLV